MVRLNKKKREGEPNVTNFRLTIEYDGRRYSGWQRQGNTDNTIQEKIEQILSRMTGHAVEINGAGRTDAGVHARLNAKGKHYRYRLCDGGVPDVFARNYVCAWEQHLDVDAMQRAAAHLVGTHDFRAMSSVNKRFKKSTVRTITQITITRKPREICFDVIGTGFLYNMVRILIGTLVEVGEGKRTPDSMPAILDSLDRQQAGVTMPPQGLTLETVLY